MFPKKCSCGRTHDAADWTMLHLVGWQTIGDERLELRNCACGSTLAIPAPLSLLFQDPAAVAATDAAHAKRRGDNEAVRDLHEVRDAWRARSREAFVREIAVLESEVA
jgi:hypothetical protein